jgi:hypothetical protein
VPLPINPWLTGHYAKLLRGAESAEQEAEPAPEETPPICGVHQVPMVKVNGRRGAFWSYHENNPDGSWCSYRPKEH